MPGTVTFDPPPIPLARVGEMIRVCRYDSESGEFDPLYNIRCLGIQYREGADPGVARFRYQFDPANLSNEFPQRIEDVFGFDSGSMYRVRQDDRLCVLKDDADGEYMILFDGFAQVPQGDLGPSTEQVTFQALGTAVREWDTPIKGAIHRNEDDPETASDVQTGLPTRFNPDGIPNCIPDNYAGEGLRKYPTFLSAKFIRSPDTRIKWSLGSAVRYLVAVGNPDEEYVKNPRDYSYFDNVLKARVPKEGSEFYDPSDASTYDEEDIDCQDFDATGDCWVEVVSKLINVHGFILQFFYGTSEEGKPYLRYDILRRDGGSGIKPKSLKLQLAGESLDPGQTNVGTLSLSRDSTEIANTIYLDTAPKEYEASFILAAGFAIDVADATTNLTDFIEGGANWLAGTNRNKYRDFIFDETGEGHWDFPTVSTSTVVPSLDKVLGPPASDETKQYVKRRRPGKFTLFTKDTTGKPEKAQLWISTDYNGLNPPCIWDGTGTWQKVQGGFDLMKDRLGIKYTNKNPDDWPIGPSKTASAPYPAGKVRIVKSLADPASPNPRFYLRLTTVIEGDQDLSILADRRSASPSQFKIKRRIDTRDRFVREVIAPSSQFNTNPIADNTFVFARDDTDDAEAYANAYRAAHEVARFAGTVTIPRITLAYGIGDPVRAILGRDISLQQNIGKDQGEGRQYPYVCAIGWDFDGKQETTLQLSDRRAEATVRRQT